MAPESGILPSDWQDRVMAEIRAGARFPSAAIIRLSPVFGWATAAAAAACVLMLALPTIWLFADVYQEVVLATHVPSVDWLSASM
jgi:hypothetical protein